jgi:hypothetical protein
MARRAIVLSMAGLSAFCVLPAYATHSGLGILGQNYWASTYEYYEALVVSGTSSSTFGPTAEPVVKFVQGTTPPVAIRYHALWPNEGSDVQLQSNAGYLSGHLAAAGVVYCPPEWTNVHLTVQLEAGGQVVFRPLEDGQVTWSWAYAQKEGPLPLVSFWSLTDMTTGEERAISTNTSAPPVGQMTLDLLASHQYSLEWYLAAGDRGAADLLASSGESFKVDTFNDLQMSLVFVPAPGAALLAVTGAGLMGLLRRHARR